jgi:hypothetical protein
VRPKVPFPPPEVHCCTMRAQGIIVRHTPEPVPLRQTPRMHKCLTGARLVQTLGIPVALACLHSPFELLTIWRLFPEPFSCRLLRAKTQLNQIKRPRATPVREVTRIYQPRGSPPMQVNRRARSLMGLTRGTIINRLNGHGRLKELAKCVSILIVEERVRLPGTFAIHEMTYHYCLFTLNFLHFPPLLADRLTLLLYCIEGQVLTSRTKVYKQQRDKIMISPMTAKRSRVSDIFLNILISDRFRCLC